MRYARIYPWRRTRRSRAPSNGPDAFFVALFSAGYTTNMFGFDLRQGQLPSRPDSSAPATNRRSAQRRSAPRLRLRAPASRVSISGPLAFFKVAGGHRKVVLGQDRSG